MYSRDNYYKSEKEEEQPTQPAASSNSDKIDFEKYDDIPVETSGRDPPKPIAGWTETDLSSEIQRNIEIAGYKKPTPVQRYSLPIVSKGRDLMSCAQTGSGKTAAFLLPIISQLFKDPPTSSYSGYDRNRKITPQALVLAPTRELACQIHDESKKFSRNTRLRMAILYGGAPMGPQLRELERGCDILVATPGRLVDVIERGRLSLAQIRYLVLDEADRMLDMGFEPQIRRIVEGEDMPPTGKRQTLMFSATFPKEIQQLAASFLHDYVFLTIGRVGSTTDLITQRFIKVADEADKEQKLLELICTIKGLTLIFVETKKKASNLDWFLRKKGFPATSIHGDREQQERTAALRDFSSGRTPFLIATNVAARGLDISNITHVINYEMPSNIDDYIHRIGRTGRAGKNGVSTSFISPDNTNIISPLVERLREGNLEVPGWLDSMRPYKRGGSSSFRGRSTTGGRGGGGYRFGARDFRSQSGPPPPRAGPISQPPNVPTFAPPPSAVHYPGYSSYMPYMPVPPAPYGMPPPPYAAMPAYPPPHYPSADDRRAPSTSASDDSKKRRQDDYSDDARDKYRRTSDSTRTYDKDYDSKPRSSSYDHDKRSSDSHRSDYSSHRSDHRDHGSDRSSSSSRHSSSHRSHDKY